MPKVIIFGAGLTGLTAARLLSEHFDVIVVEKSSFVGGLCRSTEINGTYIDIYGGHIFNSHYNKVKDFVFSVYPEENWTKHERNAKIFIDDKIIGFPFEKNLIALGEEFYQTCLYEMSDDIDGCIDFKSYLLERFGPTACSKYHFPYNQKIWQYSLHKIGISWINSGKIPVSSINDVIKANENGGSVDTGMVHSTYHYPKSGGIESLICAIYNGCPILYNSIPVSVEHIDGQYKIKILHFDGEISEYTCDIIISTIPLDNLFMLLKIPMLNLPFHGTDVLVCKSDFFEQNPLISWIYFPEQKYWWHRFSNVDKANNYILVEAPCGAHKRKMEIDLPGYKFEILRHMSHNKTYTIEPLDTDYEDTIRQLEKQNIYSIGRWGRWQYNNMDLCINDALITREKINV